MKEMRVKGALVEHKEVQAAMGVKIVAPGLETAVAGTSLYVVGPQDDEEELKDSVMEDMAVSWGLSLWLQGRLMWLQLGFAGSKVQVQGAACSAVFGAGLARVFVTACPGGVGGVVQTGQKQL